MTRTYLSKHFSTAFRTFTLLALVLVFVASCAPNDKDTNNAQSPTTTAPQPTTSSGTTYVPTTPPASSSSTTAIVEPTSTEAPPVSYSSPTTETPSPTSVTTQAPSRTLPTRVTQATFTDPTRSTPPRYPYASHPGRDLPVTFWVPDAPGRYPLVVFAHGFNVNASTYNRLLDAVAAHGFVVAAPELPGSSSSLPGTPIENDIDNIPCDLTFLADQIQADPSVPVDLGVPYVLAGQSDGATAAAWAALSDNCGHPAPGRVVALSANDVPHRHDVPLLAVTGANDTVNPPSHTRLLFSNTRAPSWFCQVPSYGHLDTFTSSPQTQAVADVIAAFLHNATLPTSASSFLFESHA